MLSCSGSEEQLYCSEGYPKEFGNRVIVENKVDIYHYKTRILTYEKSISFPSTDDRTITLLSDTELSDTQHSTTIEYERIDGCIKDWRDYQSITINDDCSLITSSSIQVGVNDEIDGTGRKWLTVFFDCEKTDSIGIEEAIDNFKQSGRFDSVYILRFTEELSIIN